MKKDVIQPRCCITSMLYYYRSWRRYSRPIYRLFCLFILAIFVGIIWSNVTSLIFGNNYSLLRNNVGIKQSPLIFCFVLSSNKHHLTSSRAILYSWGKRCDRFYFVTRLQNTSMDLMMLDKFENTSDISSTTITQQTLNVLAYLEEQQLFSSYHWFLRASDDSYVIIPNLRRLVNQLHHPEDFHPIAYVGDVEEMFEKYQFTTTGSVMLFNRNAIHHLASEDNSDDDDETHSDSKKQCLRKIIYDHEFVTCMKQIDIDINPVKNNLILSQNLSLYRMDKRLKDTCCSSDTVAFRSSNETDMYKFDFFYHRLDAASKIHV